MGIRRLHSKDSRARALESQEGIIFKTALATKEAENAKLGAALDAANEALRKADVIIERLTGRDQHMEQRVKDLEHQIKNLKQIIMGLATPEARELLKGILDRDTQK